jgi:hypothetical protein
LWATLGVLLFGFSTYYSTRLLLDRRPRFQLRRDGVINRTLWNGSALIPWTEIVDIRDTAWPGVRQIVLRDPDGWVSKQPRSVRAWSGYSRLLGFGAVPVNLWVLDANWDRIDMRLQAASEHMELEAYRTAADLPGPSDGSP